MTTDGATPGRLSLFRFPDTQSFIALALVVAMIALTFTLVFVKVPDSDVFKMLAGGLMTVGFATIIGFYFGSSAGEKAKDEVKNNAATAPLNGNGAASSTTSVTGSTAAKVVIAFLVIGSALAFPSFGGPAHAANGLVLKSRPKPVAASTAATPAKPVICDPFNLIPGCKSADTSSATAAAPDTLNDIIQKIENVEAQVVTDVVADIQAADVDAGTVLTPAIPATPTTPAVDAVVKDPISHACYPAATKFLLSLPAAQKLVGKLTGVQLFQQSRDFIAQVQAGVPTYLKLGCLPLFGDEVNIIVQILGLVGVKVLPAALTAVMPALAPITLPAMTLMP